MYHSLLKWQVCDLFGYDGSKIPKYEQNW
jgi:hypothetical protein